MHDSSLGGSATSARDGTPILVLDPRVLPPRSQSSPTVFPPHKHARTRSLSPSLTAQMAPSPPATISPPLAAARTHCDHGNGNGARRLSPSPFCHPSLALSTSPAISSVLASADALKPKPRVRNYDAVWSRFDPQCPGRASRLIRFCMTDLWCCFCTSMRVGFVRVWDFGAGPRRRRRC